MEVQIVDPARKIANAMKQLALSAVILLASILALALERVGQQLRNPERASARIPLAIPLQVVLITAIKTKSVPSTAHPRVIFRRQHGEAVNWVVPT